MFLALHCFVIETVFNARFKLFLIPKEMLYEKLIKIAVSLQYKHEDFFKTYIDIVQA